MSIQARPTLQALRRAAPALAIALSAHGAWAAPDFNPDPIGTFLSQSGLASGASNATSAIVQAPSAAASAAVAMPAALATRLRDQASEMVMTAMNFLGVKYRRGGVSAENGFDCSGFTRHVFEMSVGVMLPRRADEQAKAPGLVPVKQDDLKPGDLVFFNTLKRTFSHVGIYVGDGKFIHAPRPGGEVRVEDMRFVYWAKRFTGARRAESAQDQPTADASALLNPVPNALAPMHAVR